MHGSFGFSLSISRYDEVGQGDIHGSSRGVALPNHGSKNRNLEGKKGSN